MNSVTQSDQVSTEPVITTTSTTAARAVPRSEGFRDLWCPDSRWSGSDTATLLGVGLATLVLNLFGIGELEFFRHTEADRTLIAWEMLERRELALPHLLHSLILTKPPLFYWMLAGSIALFGSAGEAIVRFPSVLCSVLWAMSHFAVLRAAGATRRGALLGVVILVTGMSFFVLAALAEIDMLFGFLCALSLSTLYLGLMRESRVLVCLAGATLGLAMLAKGPPAVAFYGVALGVGWILVSRPRPGGTGFFLRWNLVGGLIALAIVAPWLITVGSQVGYDALAAEFHREILDRVVRETHHVRGWSFYMGTLLVAHLPWSVLLVPAAVQRIRREPTERFPADLNAFLVYHAVILSAVFVMLSIAEGKSNRYIFPVYGSGAVLIFGLVLSLLGSAELRRMYAVLGPVVRLVSVSLPCAALMCHFPKVLPATAFGVACLCGVALAALGWSFARRHGEASAAAIVLVTAALRVGYAEIYAPARNADRSVKAMAEEIDAAMPPGAVLYNIEIFDRWINYYLKRLGRESFRITPEEAKHPQIAGDGRTYVLLDMDEEAWRYEELKEADAGMTEVKRFRDPLPASALVAVDPSVLEQLHVHNHFPTVPSAPYYFDQERAARWNAEHAAPSPVR